MLVGGTGITPMIQALHAILGTPEDETKVSKLGDRLAVTHVLSEETSSEWQGPTGFISKELIESHLPPASAGSDIQIWVCGPPPMYDALCGPRGEQNVSGVLGGMGY